MLMLTFFIVSVNIQINMYRFVILSFLISMAVPDILDKKQCAKVFQPNAMRCCQKNFDTIYKLIMTDDIAECFQVSKDPVLCEREICIAKKKGFATDDNKIDKMKLEELMNKDLGSDPEILADVKSKCLEGNFDKYAPPDYCDFMKMRHCVSMQMLNTGTLPRFVYSEIISSTLTTIQPVVH